MLSVPSVDPSCLPSASPSGWGSFPAHTWGLERTRNLTPTSASGSVGLRISAIRRLGLVHHHELLACHRWVMSLTLLWYSCDLWALVPVSQGYGVVGACLINTVPALSGRAMPTVLRKTEQHDLGTLASPFCCSISTLPFSQVVGSFESGTAGGDSLVSWTACAGLGVSGSLDLSSIGSSQFTLFFYFCFCRVTLKPEQRSPDPGPARYDLCPLLDRSGLSNRILPTPGATCISVLAFWNTCPCPWS